MTTEPDLDHPASTLSDSVFAALADGDSARIDEARRAKERVEHLFRYSLQRHHINPLMHLVWRYRKKQIAEVQDALG